MISIVPTMPSQGAQAPAKGSGQPGAGIFEGVLLQAMLGARGAMAGAAATGGPSALLTGTQAGSQRSSPAGAQVLVQAGEVLAQLVAEPVAELAAAVQGQADLVPQLPSPAPIPAEPAALPDATGPGLTIQMDTESLSDLLGAPSAEDDSDAPVPAAGSEADAALVSQVQAALAAQVQAQAQGSAVPAPSTAPDAPVPGQQVQAAVLAATPADPALDAFVQEAVRSVQTEAPVATEPAQSKQEGAGPTFQDLVNLVMDADQARPEPQPGGGGGAQPQDQPPADHEAAAPKGDEQTQAGPVSANSPASQAGGSAAAAPDGPAEGPRQPVEPEQVLRQVTRFIKVMVDAKQSEVRLNLHPEHLGHIAVKLIVGDGAIRANLVAQDMAVKAALEANLDSLKTRLQDQGFQVEQVHVSVGSDGGFAQHSRHGEQRQQQHGQPSWRPARGETMAQQDPAPAQSRPATAPWTVRGTGVRLNSLA